VDDQRLKQLTSAIEKDLAMFVAKREKRAKLKRVLTAYLAEACSTGLVG